MEIVENTESSRLEKALAELSFDTAQAQEIANALNDETAERCGRALWQSMCGATMDDRPLYWMRLWIQHRAALRGASASAIERFEKASRGTDFSFDTDVDRRVIVTGFDPFHLDVDVRQSNPSGVVALRLHDQVRRINGLTVAFKTTIAPVRFNDFDRGYIESLLTPVMQEKSFDLMTTVSMGREHFDLERFPGRRRSAAEPDNERRLTGASEAHPLTPELDGKPLAGPEFLEYTLPGAIMRAPGRYQVNINSRVQTLEKGSLVASRLQDLNDQTAVNGSGGGYLSNEISYRTLRLGRQYEVTAPMGHIHTPRLVGHDSALLEAIVEQAERLIESAIV